MKDSAVLRRLQLQLPDRGYDIVIGDGVISSIFDLSAISDNSKVLVVSNEVVAPLFLEKITTARPSCHQLILADGEKEKNQQNLFKMLEYLLSHQFHRNDYIIALGGGVIGDMAGLAASLYQRGMQLVQVPTTLLAQVDSSVGGKTAINHPLGKNMIGAFYQPNAVIIDTNSLVSLPKREYLAGLGEVAKYALLGNYKIEKLLLNNSEEVLSGQKEVLAELIELSCQTKANIVEADEKESGSRALLNLGHSFAHAIELAGNYQQYLHGEAVAIGIHMAINFSLLSGLIDQQTAVQKHRLLEQLKLIQYWQRTCSTSELIDKMRLDKKNQTNKFRLVLPTNNNCEILETEDIDMLSKAIDMQTF